MEGKVAIMSVVLVSLLVVLGQIQVDAQTTRSCCPSTSARNIYNTCRFAGGSQSLCASTSGCRHLTTCPAGWRHDMLENKLENTGKAIAYTMEDGIASKSCCPNATARARYDVCLATPPTCARNAGCILVPTGLPCPPRWTHDMLENTVNEYCKFGCMSSVCGSISNLKKADVSEVVNGAVEKCSDACSDFCTKGSITAVEAVETA